MTTRRQWSRWSAVATASVVTASLALVSALPTATPAWASSGHTRVTGCTPSDLSATLILSPVGGSSSSLAGAVLFANVSGKPCQLHGGIPKMRVVDPTGVALAVTEVPAISHHVQSVTLLPSATKAALPDAGSSITWSSWSCAEDSFALDVQFTGWSSPLTVPWGSTTGYAGAPCVGGDAALFVGPLARAKAPA